MGTFAKPIVRIPKNGINQYTQVAKEIRMNLTADLKNRCLAVFSDYDCSTLQAVASSMYFQFPGMPRLMDRYELLPDVEEIFTAAFSLHQAFGEKVLPKNWSEDIESRLANFFCNNYSKETAVSAASELFRIWAVCALIFGNESTLYFYEKQEGPFALLSWRNLPSSVEENIFLKFPEFDLGTASEIALEDIPIDLKTDLELVLRKAAACKGITSEEQDTLRNNIKSSMGTALAKARFEVWKDVTNELPDPEQSGLQFSVLNNHDKVLLLKDILVHILYTKEETAK